MDIKYIVAWIVLSAVAFILIKLIYGVMYSGVYTKDSNYILQDMLSLDQIVEFKGFSLIKSYTSCYCIVLELEGREYFRDASLLEIDREKAEFFYSKQRLENVHIKKHFIRKDNNNTHYIQISTDTQELAVEVAEDYISKFNDFNIKALDSQALIFYLKKVVSNYDCIEGGKKLNNLSSVVSLCNFTSVQDSNIIQINGNQTFGCSVFHLSINNDYSDNIIQDILNIYNSSTGLRAEVLVSSYFLSNSGSKEVIRKKISNLEGARAARNNPLFGFILSILKIDQDSDKGVLAVQEHVYDKTATIVYTDLYVYLFARSNETNRVLEDAGEQLKRLDKYDVEYRPLKDKLAIISYLQRVPLFFVKTGIKSINKASAIQLNIFCTRMLSIFFSYLVTYKKLPEGYDSCAWGDSYITEFTTQYNNSYKFIMHNSSTKDNPLAHSIVVAGSGSGKSTFMMNIIDNAMDKFLDLKVFTFDSNNGLSVFNAYKDGIDIDFNDMGVNPFIDAIGGTKEDEIFLIRFIKMIGDFSIEDEEHINNCVKGIVYLPKEYGMNKITDWIKQRYGNTAKKLAPWLDGEYRIYLSDEKSEFNVNENRFINIQFTDVIKDKEVSAPLMSCIMHKIRTACAGGVPHLIFIDEASKMLENEKFADEVKIMLREHRKIKGSINLAFQGLSDMHKSSIANVIQDNIANLIYLSSVSVPSSIDIAKREDFLRIYHLSEDMLKTFNAERMNGRQRRVALLIKRSDSSSESVILDVDLKDKGERLLFYSSNSQNVAHMHTAKKIAKDSGSDWKEIYLSILNSPNEYNQHFAEHDEDSIKSSSEEDTTQEQESVIEETAPSESLSDEEDNDNHDHIVDEDTQESEASINNEANSEEISADDDDYDIDIDSVEEQEDEW